MPRLALRYSLPMMVLGAFLLFSLFALYGFYHVYREALILDTEQRLQTNLARLARLAQTAATATTDGEEVAREIALMPVGWSAVRAVALLDGQYRVIHAHRSDWRGRPLAELVPLGLLAPTPALGWDDQRHRLRVLHDIVPLWRNLQDPARAAMIYVEIDIRPQLEAGFKSQLAPLAWLLGGGLLTTLVLFLWLRRRLVQPLTALTEMAERIDEARPLQIATPAAASEVVTLIGALDRMLARLTEKTESLQAAQQALMISEQKYRLLADHLSDLVFWVAPEGAFRFVSPSFQTLTGYGVAELEADPGLFARLIHEEDYPRFRDHLARFDQAGVADIEFRLLCADGSVRWFAHHCRPLYAADGAFLGRLSINRDVTAHKQAEQALKEALTAAERFRDALDQVDAHVFMKDGDSRYFYANQRTLELLGCRLEELIGKPDEAFFPPETAARHRETDRRVLAGESIAVENEVVLRDGSTRVFWVVKSPIYLSHEDGRREIWGISGIATDITERRQVENRLRLALQVVEASPVVSFRWRAEAGWPVAYVSQNVTRWGYDPEALLAGRPPYLALIHPDDAPRIAREVAEHTAAGSEQYTQIYRVRAADGHYFWVEDNTRVVRDAAGQVLAYEGVVTDIDTKKRYEEELAAKLAEQRELVQKLEAAQNQLLQSEKMAALGQLAAGIAHEVNNPVGFVSSNLGTLAEYLAALFAILDAYERLGWQLAANTPGLAEVEALKRHHDYAFLRQDVDQLLAESKEGLARVSKIVKDLKDFARAGDVERQWADLHAGLDSTLNIVWNELKYKCTVSKRYGELPLVWCEPSQINQVFLNLLVNAGQAIAERGEIIITTGRRGDEVFVAIADTGCGIAPEHLKRIFDPFFTTKPVGQGTGLGLSLAYSIVQKHQGRIEVHSELGKGSTFTVWLPIEPPAAPADAVPPAPTLESV